MSPQETLLVCERLLEGTKICQFLAFFCRPLEDATHGQMISAVLVEGWGHLGKAGWSARMTRHL